ncbi:MAG: leucine-rich repeat protein [Clostridium sp.]|uniref:leucine-rich repeat domain-containing protein n=1 Tax=Clostridium sp. TaxID=1506 RepID=UPI0025C24309|nr:leucine-rich repeat protein [Clostridium sp.]MCE5221515.1 leucine-rich repeat protein [Clostridium sp.]
MKKLKLTKLLAGTLVIASVLTLNPIAANAEWKQDNKGWWYAEGNSWAKGWREIDRYSYYFKSNGYMLSNPNEMYFDKEYGMNSSGQFTNVTINGDWAFCKQTGKIVAYLGSQSIINIPTQIDNITVTGIGAYAFSSSKITSVTIPSTVTIIGVKAFSGCSNLTNLTIPNSVKTIATYAFDGCRSLTNITIPSSVNKFGNGIFRGCLNLTNVTVENGITFLGNATFSGCIKLTNITLPNTLNSIGESTFEGCISLKNIVIPSGVTDISNTAFYYCISLTNLTLPDGVTHIGMGAFKDCTSLTSITIPSSVQNIETHKNGPFNKVIETNLFEGCGNVTVYVKSETTKQLLVNSGVSANKIIVTA